MFHELVGCRVESGGVSLSIKSLVLFADALEIAGMDLFEPPTAAGEAHPRTTSEENSRELKP